MQLPGKAQGAGLKRGMRSKQVANFGELGFRFPLDSHSF